MKRFTLGDGLRGIAAIGVVAAHSHLPLPLSYLNAYWPDFFFVLSGLVLAKYFDPKRTQSSFAKFALKRMVRFYPLTIASVLTLLAVVFIQQHLGSVTAWPGYLTPLNVISAMALLQLIYTPATTVLNPLWSLSAELFINLLGYWPARRFGTPILIAVICLGVVGESFLVASAGDQKFFYYITGGMSLCRVAVGFALGLLIAKYQPEKSSWLGWLATTLLLATLVLLPTTGLRMLVAPFTFAVAIRQLLPLEPKFASSRFRPLAHFLGTSSFGIYVWHPALQPICFTIAKHISDVTSVGIGYVYFAVLLTAALTATRVGYRLIEKPTMDWINARTRISAASQ